MLTVLYTVLIILGVIVVFSLYNYFQQKKILTTLTEDEFRAGYRKAQLIDVREQNHFEGGHILGARNIPLSQFKMRLTEIRADKPVYLYAQNEIGSGRAAQILYKKGYRKLYHLSGGYKNWTGPIKTK